MVGINSSFPMDQAPVLEPDVSSPGTTTRPKANTPAKSASAKANWVRVTQRVNWSQMSASPQPSGFVFNSRIVAPAALQLLQNVRSRNAAKSLDIVSRGGVWTDVTDPGAVFSGNPGITPIPPNAHFTGPPTGRASHPFAFSAASPLSPPSQSAATAPPSPAADDAALQPPDTPAPASSGTDTPTTVVGTPRRSPRGTTLGSSPQTSPKSPARSPRTHSRVQSPAPGSSPPASPAMEARFPIRPAATSAGALSSPLGTPQRSRRAHRESSLDWDVSQSPRLARQLESLGREPSLTLTRDRSLSAAPALGREPAGRGAGHLAPLTSVPAYVSSAPVSPRLMPAASDITVTVTDNSPRSSCEEAEEDPLEPGSRRRMSLSALKTSFMRDYTAMEGMDEHAATSSLLSSAPAQQLSRARANTTPVPPRKSLDVDLAVSDDLRTPRPARSANELSPAASKRSRRTRRGSVDSSALTANRHRGARLIRSDCGSGSNESLVFDETADTPRLTFLGAPRAGTAPARTTSDDADNKLPSLRSGFVDLAAFADKDEKLQEMIHELQSRRVGSRTSQKVWSGGCT
eukprot:TRINITY_DN11710_c0_g1_i1.p1 TRINITY_DN11710_c0_g1~~TRINITY_DN11710_c0_g1_i1.p1  ORF type:complete len:575 (+),score=131.37 TRINITY_DN11710_c0_g1_i1:144-1868(+)